MAQLNGQDLRGFIKERQAKQVRQLKQQYKLQPKLAIISACDNPTITTYVNLKKKYGSDIGIDVDYYAVKQQDLAATIDSLNKDNSVTGIIVQLPLQDKSQTNEIIALVDKFKDVDGLSSDPIYDAATPMAINWLLAGYGIDLKGKNLCIIGYGKLVGEPLNKIWQKSGFKASIIDIDTKNRDEIIMAADVIVTAVGKPGLLKSSQVKKGAVVVDAGVASEKGILKGDAEDAIYLRDDVTITPKKGGVGPLTVSALFDNVIRACNAGIQSK